MIVMIDVYIIKTEVMTFFMPDISILTVMYVCETFSLECISLGPILLISDYASRDKSKERGRREQELMMLMLEHDYRRILITSLKVNVIKKN